MSSPAPSAAGDSGPKKALEQITFRFCSECSNMLYPKEDEVERKLLFTCRTCNFSTEATSSCIYRNIMNNKAGETAGVTQDVGSDPTVGAPFSPCSDASNRSHMGDKLFCCTHCGIVIICEICRENNAAMLVRREHVLPPGAKTASARTLDKPTSTKDEDLASLLSRTGVYFEQLDLDEDNEWQEPDGEYQMSS